jgi:hypothetical protein
MPAHRYWGLNLRAEYFFITLYEVEMRDTVGGTNLAASATAFADSENSIYTPAQLNDGDTTGVNYWRSGTVSIGERVRIWYDFGSPVEPAEILVNSLDVEGGEHITEFDYEYSDDGSSWTTVETFDGIDFDTTNPQTFTVSEPSAISHVVSASAEESGGNTNDITLTMTGAAEGDFALAFSFGDYQVDLATHSLLQSGWTLIAQENRGDGRDRTAYVWQKTLGAGETTVTMQTDIAQERMFGVSVFRADNGVEFDVSYDDALHFGAGVNDSTPDAGSITTVTENAAVVCFLGVTHDDITASGAPSGYTLGFDEFGLSHRQGFSAYNLDVGASGVKSPGDWTNTDASNVGEYITFIFALRQSVVIASPVKVWNGTEWIASPLSVWDGSEWVIAETKVWNGSEWA